jgi:hypothetical protein
MILTAMINVRPNVAGNELVISYFQYNTKDIKKIS